MDINSKLAEELHRLIHRPNYTCMHCKTTVLVEYLAAHAAICSPSTRQAQALLTMNASGEVREDIYD